MNFSHYKTDSQPYLHKWGKKCAVSLTGDILQSERALPAKHTVEVQVRLVFPISNSCIPDTDQWLYPQLFGLLVCHIVTVKRMVTGTQRLWGGFRNHGTGAIVPVGGLER